MKDLFNSIKTIAVVGLSDKPDRPSYVVADYLKRHGFKIIPVNPTIESTLGEKSYPSLDKIPEPIDVVDSEPKSGPKGSGRRFNSGDG